MPLCRIQPNAATGDGEDLMHIHDEFTTGLDPRWQITQTGAASVVRRPSSLHLTLLPTENDHPYSNAQITEYQPAKRDFQCAPPLRMRVKAYSSLHPKNMQGTAGFGFWNHPFEPGQRGFGRPQAVWFLFAAPPNNMPLAQGVAGNGWKAATFNAKTALFALLAPFAPLGVLLMRNANFYARLWGIAQRALGVQEAVLPADLLTAEHEYTLEWRSDGAKFFVDDKLVLETDRVPRQTLGFIAWMDNQYRVVTPQGQFGGGVVPIPKSQSLVLTEITIEPL
jgi:hypothetical protein